jgi:type I restriction enzyme M protein
MSVAASTRAVTLNRLRTAYDQFRGIASITEFGTLALSMVFIRATRRSDWQDWPQLGDLVTDGLLRELGGELGPGVDPTANILRELPNPALTGLIEVIEPAAELMGDARTFQLILEELAWDRDVLTPESVAAIMTSVIGIDSGATVYDPFCRAGELLIAAAAQTRPDSPDGEVALRGDSPDFRSQAIARMNTRLHHAEAGIGQQSDAGLTKALRPSRILTNPPFNAKQWARRGEHHWPYGRPPQGNANFAWLQYVTDQLEPGGRAAVVMANNAAFSANPHEQEIREGMVADGCVEALISLPPSLFRGTRVSATIWLLNPPGIQRDEILFVDASGAGHMASRTLRELNAAEVDEIADIVIEWRSGPQSHRPGTAVRSTTAQLPEVRERDYNLSPSVYVPEPDSGVSPRAELPMIREIRDRLTDEYASAQVKDARAIQTLGALLR